jgi:hypothetical protein
MRLSPPEMPASRLFDNPRSLGASHPGIYDSKMRLAAVQRPPPLDQLPVLRDLGNVDGFHAEKHRADASKAKNRGMTAK